MNVIFIHRVIYICNLYVECVHNLIGVVEKRLTHGRHEPKIQFQHVGMSKCSFFYLRSFLLIANEFNFIYTHFFRFVSLCIVFNYIALCIAVF